MSSITSLLGLGIPLTTFGGVNNLINAVSPYVPQPSVDQPPFTPQITLDEILEVVGDKSPDGSIVAHRNSSGLRTFWVPFNKLNDAINLMLGYSWADKTPRTIRPKRTDTKVTQKFEPFTEKYVTVVNNIEYPALVQRRLHRVHPQQHPLYPWMRAVKAINIRGVKFDGQQLRAEAPILPYAQYVYAEFTIVYDHIGGNFFSDDQMEWGDPDLTKPPALFPIPEWARSCYSGPPKPFAEYKSVKGGQVYFLDGGAAGPDGLDQQAFGGEERRILIQSQLVTLTWRQIPFDYIFAPIAGSGWTIPTNRSRFYDAKGKVNAYNWNGYEYHECLLEDVELIAYPSYYGPVKPDYAVPQMVDVNMVLRIFSPSNRALPFGRTDGANPQPILRQGHNMVPYKKWGYYSAVEPALYPQIAYARLFEHYLDPG
ncbi:MAG: hypothetical protein EB117_12210, partial [Betaproteobacteria bacterium]|nr:hypothetical protein [Betaproteobacteria bacterium]